MIEAARGDGNPFPVPFSGFARALRGTPDEVFTKLMQIRHGREKHTLTQWSELLETHRQEPAHPGA